MRVLVTGAAGCLGRALLPALCDAGWISAVTAVDLRPIAWRHSRLTAVRRDFRDLRVASVLGDHDALVHLGWVVLRGHMNADEMRAVNVEGSLRLLRRASEAGVARLIHLSSAAVYGSGSGLGEDAPLDPLPGFLYAAHKAEVEERLAAEIPECTRLRCAPILGPNAQPLLRRLLRARLAPRLPEPQPLLQVVHEQDAVDAILALLQRPVPGPLNLAADALSFREAMSASGRTPVAVPIGLLKAVVRIGWRMFGAFGETAWVEGLARPISLDCRRAALELGWTPRRSSRQAIRETLLYGSPGRDTRKP